MATVIKKPDDTFIVTLDLKEQKTLNRMGSERPAPQFNKAEQLQEEITNLLLLRAQTYRAIDGPSFRDKYEALSPTKQAEIDVILNSV